MTHTAVEVVLRSLAHKLSALDQEDSAQHIAEAVGGLRLFKEISNDDQYIPDGCEGIAAKTSSNA